MRCLLGEKPEAGGRELRTRQGSRVAALVFLALAASWGEFFEEELTFRQWQSSLRKGVGEAIENVAKRKAES